MSDTGTASGALSFDLNNVSLKLPEFWVTNTQVWFAQTEVQFAVHRIFLSLPKFYYCVGALGRSDAAQIVDLIKFCPDEQPNESLTELHTLNPTPSAPFLQTRLLTTAGSPLPCFGARSIPLLFGSQHFSWSFQLAPVSFPILGSDFLSHHALLVDVAGARVLDADSLDILSAFPSPSALDSFCAHLQFPPLEIRKLLSKYPYILSSYGFSASSPKHGVFHNLSTIPGPLVFTKAHSLDPDNLASPQAEFLKMEKAGIVRHSSSSWSSPLLMVPKPDWSVGWPFGDFHCLNTAMAVDRYPLQTVADFTTRITGSAFFSKLDLQKGYFQISMHPTDIPKTAIITPFGLFEFLRLPFGFWNTAQTFQRNMDKIFGNLLICLVYLSILVFSHSLDRNSCWPEVVPLSSTSAEDCAPALVSCWISRFGVPAKINSYCGAQFTFSRWSVLCSLQNISCSKTTSFHPQSNGLVERFYFSLKASLCACLAAPD